MKKIFSIIIVVLLILIIIYDIYFVFKFDTIYEEESEISFVGEIISLPEKKENYNRYIIKTIYNSKIKNSKNTNMIAYIKEDIILFPGDIIKINGKFNKAQSKRNYGGFNYRNYLKQKKVYGIVYVDNVSIIENKFDIYNILGKVKKSINDKINLLYKNQENSFLKSILIGESEELEDEIKENFRKSSLSHILAISGMHISYIVLALKFILEKTIKRKKLENNIIIIFLVFFSILTGLKPSCIRACTMYSFILLCENMYRKNNVKLSIILTFFILILFNPYNIFSVGLWLSFMGTIGIILFSDLFYKLSERIIKKHINDSFRKNNTIKVILYIINIFVICFSAQILIFPIMIYVYNSFSLSFFISNFFSSFLIGPVLILGFLSIIISYIFIPISNIISLFESNLIKLLIVISKICSKIPLSNIKVVTPNIMFLFLYYFIIILIICYYNKNRVLLLKVILAFCKIKQTKKTKKIINMITCQLFKVGIFICIFIIIINFIRFDKDLRIYFVDVGQGDCTVIQTPHGKNIIIDGGEGGESSKYDYGKNVVLPYLLDRKIWKIDYMIISHFDSDHVGRPIYYY